MTTAPARAVPHPVPRPKSVAPSAAAAQPAATSKAAGRGDPQDSRQASQQQPSYLSDRATTLLIRRTLCSQLADKNAPISDLLPPLTSSNEVDLQLYAFIAIIIREFVYPWYSKITPDQTFVEEVIKIIAHCTRGLEQRLRKVDLEALIFDELPELLDAHVQAYRTAHRPIHPEPLEADPRLIYHSLWPSPALSPVPGKNDPASVLIQKENEAAYRQLLVQGILAILLPTEDFQNDSLTSLVGQILSEMILGNGVGGKACEPWFIWQGITKVAEIIQTKLPESKARKRARRSLAEDETPGMPRSADQGKMQRLRWSIQKTFWLVLQYAFFAMTAVRFVIISIVTSSSLPSRLGPSRKGPSRKVVGKQPVAKNMQAPTRINSGGEGPDPPLKHPMLSMKVWACASRVLELDARMPWVSGTLSLLQWMAVHGPGGLGYTDSMMDRLLSHTLSTHVLDARLIPALLRTGRAALFPCNNATLTSTPVVLLADEVLALKRRCAETLLDLIPVGIQEVYFGGVRGGNVSTGYEEQVRESQDDDTPSPVESKDGTEPDRDRDSERGEQEERIFQIQQGILDVFDDDYCNRHLMYGIVELICVRLMPELAERGILELVEERE